MYILHVVPIARGIHAETLTYFSVKYVVPGFLVRVTYNHRELIALVAKTELLRDLKTDIKELYFQIKNITDVVNDYVLPEACIQASKSIAEFGHFKLHAVLSQTIPKSYIEFLENQKNTQSKSKNITSSIPVYQSALQAPTYERYDIYKTLGREHLSRNESLVIVVPTQYEATRLCEIISKGIEDRVLCMHGKLSKKKIIETYERLFSDTKSFIIVTTPLFLSTLPEHISARIGMYICENESSDAYITNKEPFIHMREYVIELARFSKTPLLFGASLLSFDLLRRIDEGGLESYQPPRNHLDTDSIIQVYERDQKSITSGKKKTWELFLPETHDFIKKRIEQKEPIFFFVPRKGYSSFILCTDCQTPVTCEHCHHHLTLYTRNGSTGTRTCKCHYCKKVYPAVDACSNCGGHALELFGVHSERVAEELYTLFPDTPIVLLDAAHAKNETSIKKIIETWQTQGGFLVGTHLALTHLHAYDHVCIPSIESLLARPEYDTEERVARLLIDILEKTKRSCILQVQNTIYSNSLVYDIRNKNISEYIRRELALRKSFMYPPYAKLLYIRFIGKSLAEVQQVCTPLQKHILEYAPYFLERTQTAAVMRPTGVFLVLKIPVSPGTHSSPLDYFIEQISLVLDIELYSGSGV